MRPVEYCYIRHNRVNPEALDISRETILLTTLRNRLLAHTSAESAYLPDKSGQLALVRLLAVSTCDWDR